MIDKIKSKNIPEKCINCKYCRNLSIFHNRLETIGGRNIISGVKISKEDSKYDKSLCCIVQKDNIFAPIFETNKNDLCERYEPKEFNDVYNMDTSSMYDTKMISMNIHNDNKGKIHIEEKKED